MIEFILLVFGCKLSFNNAFLPVGLVDVILKINMWLQCNLSCIEALLSMGLATVETIALHVILVRDL